MPICFMVMPFGIKPNADPQRGPGTIDFNALWEKALKPVIEQLGYEAIRADQELGAMIILEMIERLAASDLVVADVTIPNGNVYYEVGVRHAARPLGCVMIAADWSRQLFDIDQMRRVAYPLAEGAITDETANAIKTKLLTKDALKKMAAGKSPVFQCLPWHPGTPPAEKEREMKAFAQRLADFQTEARQVRLAPKSERAGKALALRDRYLPNIKQLPAAATEIMYLLRDTRQWSVVRDFIDALPEDFRKLTVMQEQRSLAQSQLGNHTEAIAVLEQLIAEQGDTSERRGLLGGRYKRLYFESTDETDPNDKAGYLDSAIEQYTAGMNLDLNDYFPASNLPRLLRLRNQEGDEKLAREAAIITVHGAERALVRNPTDQWVLPTLLGAAFDAGDVAKASKLIAQIRWANLPEFPIETTAKDLRVAVSLTRDEATKSALCNLIERFEGPKTS